jgi:LysR family hydrogen peroxide-inducible transcriptional activator
MTFRELEYLVAVADHQHFGRAAEACFVSQPTLSTQLKKLEVGLGVELVERRPGHVVLTEAGVQVVQRARVILAKAATIRGVATRAKDPESGTLRIGLFPTLAPYLLPHVVHPLHERFPRIELQLVEEKTDVVVHQLEDGNLDAGVLARPVDAQGLDEDLLFAEDFVLAVPADHGLARAVEPVALGSIAAEPILLLEDGHCLRQHALDVCRLAGAREHMGFRATSLETLRQMVAAGVGITLLPRLACQPPVPRSEDVKILRIADPAPRREIALYSRPGTVPGDLLPQIAGIMRDMTAGLATDGAILAGVSGAASHAGARRHAGGRSRVRRVHRRGGPR